MSSILRKSRTAVLCDYDALKAKADLHIAQCMVARHDPSESWEKQAGLTPALEEILREYIPRGFSGETRDLRFRASCCRIVHLYVESGAQATEESVRAEMQSLNAIWTRPWYIKAWQWF